MKHQTGTRPVANAHYNQRPHNQRPPVCFYERSRPPQIARPSSVARPAPTRGKGYFKRFRGAPSQPTVHREAEQYVVQRVDQLARDYRDGDTPHMPIINLWGITGIGKSYIVRNLLTTTPHLRVLWLDFAAQSSDTDAAAQRTALPSHLPMHATRLTLAQLIERLDATELFGTPSRAVFDWQDEPIDSNDQTVTCLSPQTQVPLDPSHPPQLVLLDGIDDLPYWQWVQEYVIRPLIERPVQVQAPLPCVVVTSQMPLFWHFWELRERCEMVEVPPFDPEETTQFLALAQHRHPDLLRYTTALHTATEGYPYGLAYARDRLINVLEARIRDLDPLSLTGIMPYLALVRRPNKRMMRTMLDTVQPPAWNTLLGQGVAPFDAIDDGLAKLAQIGTIDRHSQCVTPAVRQHVERETRARDRATYRAICEVLAREYQRRLRNTANKEVHFFLDWLYYATSVQLLDRQTAQPPACEASAPTPSFVAELKQLIGITGLLEDNLTEHFANDTELQQRLYQAGTLTLVCELLGTEPASSAGLEPEVATAMEGYAQHVTARLEEQVPLGYRKRVKNFFAVVAGFAKHEAFAATNAFSSPELRNALREQGLRLRELNELVPILHNRGFFLYDSAQRTYLLNRVLLPVVKRFVPLV